MSDDALRLIELIVNCRLCFHRLAAVADALHADLGINAAMRGVLESLSGGADWTVPRIARAKGVSRQHIQVTVDTLRAAGLVELRPNPAHRRSPLVVASEKGAAVFAEMRRREGRVLKELAAELTPAGITTTRDTLAALNDLLDQQLKTIHKGDRDD